MAPKCYPLAIISVLLEDNLHISINWPSHIMLDCSYKFSILYGSGYGYGIVSGGRWAIDTEGGHVVVSVSLIRNTRSPRDYSYRKRSRGKFRIPSRIRSAINQSV